MLPLVVKRIESQSAGILSIELGDPDGVPLPPWEAGAHIDVQLVTRQQRQYSLCGDPADRGTYRIAVLREEYSRGASMYIHEYLREGRTVHASAPRNLFPIAPADEYLLLAAGIGITPILAMANELERRGATWSMNYAIRDGADLPFRADLDALGQKVTINSPDRAGRLDLESYLAEPRPGVAVYTCGPARFTDAVLEAMREWPRGSLHLERFEPKPAVVRANEPFTVRVEGTDVAVEVPADRSMLAALNSARVPVAGSCLRGICGSCAVRVVDGKAEHRDSLTSDEDSTTMYPCVSRALTPELVIAAPE
ncbi:ferredoxin-NADP reductase [Conyzicola lurida]|uniref:Ferredoxin-NADP reductase n=1 Tax=Conyzicola lurida TaxID=1172621 RepID=A0A841AK13_9MICO|nr:PDR/VanB family oxidoreductase [Conyzicola lurida]MBB5842051.1 ferredoxin-NADP reductase [Conyzicola lurida]